MGVKIFKGINRPFHMGKIFGREDLKGIERLSFLEKEQIPGKSFHVAAHIIERQVCSSRGLALCSIT